MKNDNDANASSLESVWTLLRMDSGESEEDMRRTRMLNRRQSRRSAERERQRREMSSQSHFDGGAESFLDTICGEELSDKLGRALDRLFLVGPDEEEEVVRTRSPKPKQIPKKTEEQAPFDLHKSFSDFMESRDAEEEQERHANKRRWFGRRSSKRRLSSAGRA